MKRWVPLCIAAVLEIVLVAVALFSGIKDYMVLRSLWIVIGINLLLVILPLTVRLLGGKPAPTVPPPAKIPVTLPPQNENDPMTLYKRGVKMLSSDFITREDHKTACRMIITAAKRGCKEAVDYLNNLPPEQQAQIQP